MTPEEFTARASAAVAGVEPDATSYEWLTRNVSRRTRGRRLLWAATAATAAVATGVAVAVVPGGGGERGHVATTPTASPTSPAPVLPTRIADPDRWAGQDERRVDVDGDGREDRVRVVRQGEPMSDAFRWGVEVRFGNGSTGTYLDPCCGNEGQSLGPIVDFDGDGDLEIAVSPGSTASSTGWRLLTLRDGELAQVEGPDLLQGWDAAGEHSWGCAERGGLVVATAALDMATMKQGTTGTRTYYRLEGTRLVEAETVTDTWGDGGARPREYDYGFFCP
ncbi:MAG TPA: VCBS repeat-containing protein [Frankiaceae bacterium]|jgi:hypothetical protein|nr:VCBS repeat-containing protein [Frankiaceae bacterium]